MFVSKVSSNMGKLLEDMVSTPKTSQNHISFLVGEVSSKLRWYHCVPRYGIQDAIKQGIVADFMLR